MMFELFAKFKFSPEILSAWTLVGLLSSTNEVLFRYNQKFFIRQGANDKQTCLIQTVNLIGNYEKQFKQPKEKKDTQLEKNIESLLIKAVSFISVWFKGVWLKGDRHWNFSKTTPSVEKNFSVYRITTESTLTWYVTQPSLMINCGNWFCVKKLKHTRM